MIKLISLDVDGYKNLNIKNLHFPEEGTILIMGRNESGKSSLFEAIFFALTSNILEKKMRFAEDIDYEKEQAVIDLKFEKGGKIARIRKTISRVRDSQASTYIEFWKNYEEEPNNKKENSKKVLDPEIKEFLEFDAEFLLNSCFVKQKGLASYMTQDKSIRKQIINKLLNMDRISEIAKGYKDKIKQLELIEDYFGKHAEIESNEVKDKELRFKIETLEEKRETLDNLNIISKELSKLLNINKEISEEEKEAEAKCKDIDVKIKIEEDKISVFDKYNKDLEHFKDLKHKKQIKEKEIENLNNKLKSIEKTNEEYKNEISNFKRNEINLATQNEELTLKQKEKNKFENIKSTKESLSTLESELKSNQEQLKNHERNLEKDEKGFIELESSLQYLVINKTEQLFFNCDQIVKLNDILKQQKQDIIALKEKRDSFEEIDTSLNQLTQDKQNVENKLNELNRKIESFNDNNEKVEEINNNIKEKDREINQKNNHLKELKDLESKVINFDEQYQQNRMINQRIIDTKESMEDNSNNIKENEEAQNKLKKSMKITSAESSMFIKLLPVSIGVILLAVILGIFVNIGFLALIAAGGGIFIYSLIQDKKIKSLSNSNQQMKSLYDDLELKKRELIKKQTELQKNLLGYEKREEMLKQQLENIPKIDTDVNLREVQESIKEAEGLIQKYKIQIELDNKRKIELEKEMGGHNIDDFMDNNNKIEERYNQIKAQIDALKTKNHDFFTSQENSAELKKVMNEKIEKLNNEISKIEIENNRLNKESEETSNDLGFEFIKIDREIDEKFGNSIKSLQNRMNEYKTDIETIKYSKASYWEDWNKIYERYYDVTCLNEDLQKLSDKFNDITKIKIEILNNEKNINSLSNQQNELKNALPEEFKEKTSNFNTEYSKLDTEIGEITTKIKFLTEYFSKHNIETIKKDKNKSLEELEQIKKKIAKLNLEIQNLDEKIKKLEEAIPDDIQEIDDDPKKELNKKITNLKKEKTIHESRLKTKRASLAKLITELVNDSNLGQIDLNNISTELKNHIKNTELLIDSIRKEFSIILDVDVEELADNSLKDYLKNLNKKIGGLEEANETLLNDINRIKRKRGATKLISEFENSNLTNQSQYEKAHEDKIKYTKAIYILEEGEKVIKAKIIPKTEETLTKILPILTADRYKDAKITDNYKIEVFDSKSKSYIDRSLFSGGTIDQIALAIRLSFAMVTLRTDITSESFIFLDEPLGFFDDERKNSLIDFLTHGEIANKFAQRFVISNFLDIKQHFDFIIELNNGRIIKQYSTGTLESQQYSLDYKPEDSKKFFNIELVDIAEEDNYYETILKLKNISNISFDRINLKISETEIILTPIVILSLKPNQETNMLLQYYGFIVGEKDIYMELTIYYTKNEEKHINFEKINIQPLLLS
ncbi:MAG: hypothetical protein ACTSRI_06485 [Promethearchaeota archaeon]